MGSPPPDETEFDRQLVESLNGMCLQCHIRPHTCGVCCAECMAEAYTFVGYQLTPDEWNRLSTMIAEEQRALEFVAEIAVCAKCSVEQWMLKGAKPPRWCASCKNRYFDEYFGDGGINDQKATAHLTEDDHGTR